MTPIYSITRLDGRWNGSLTKLIFEPGELLFQPDVLTCVCLGTAAAETVTGITRIEYIILVVDLAAGKCWHQPFFHDFEKPVDFQKGQIFVAFHKGTLMREQPMTDLIKGSGIKAKGFQFIA